MIYVEAIDKVNNRLAITNTVQGKTDWVSYDDVVTAVLEGARVEGCHYGSTSELQQTRKFWSVTSVSKMPLLTARVGKIYRITGKMNTTGIVLNINYEQDIVTIFVLTGETYQLRNNTVTFTAARKIPQDVRDILEEVYSLSIQQAAAKEKIVAAQRDIDKLTQRQQYLCGAIRKAQSLLSEQEVISALWGKLPSLLSLSLQKFDLSLGQRNNHAFLSMNYTHLIEKYCRNAKHSFLYEEYDGNLFVIDNPEQNAEYKEMLRRNRFTLPVKGIPWKEGLEIGDKDTIVYCSSYTLEIPDKYLPYSLATVDYIAQQLIAKSK